MKIIVNGKEHSVGDKITISQLIESLGLASPGIAVAVNDSIILRERHELHAVLNGDRIEIMRAIGGG